MSMEIVVNTKDFDKPPRQIARAIRKALNKAGHHVERGMKRLAMSGIFKHPTGRYAQSIRSNVLRDRAEIGPHVIYQYWLEEGARGKHIPKTHRKSAFLGYHIVGKTYKSNVAAVHAIINSVLETELRR